MSNELNRTDFLKELQKEYSNLILKIDSDLMMDDDLTISGGYYLNGPSLLSFAIQLTKQNRIEETRNILMLADKIMTNQIFQELFADIYLKSQEILNISVNDSNFLNNFLTLVLTGKHINTISISKSSLTYFIYLFIYGKIEIKPERPTENTFYEFILFNDMAPYYIVFQ